MHFFHNIYASFYFFYTWQKRVTRRTIFDRIGDVDFHAITLMVLSKMLIAANLMTFASKQWTFNAPIIFLFVNIIVIIIGYFEYRYIKSNLERRRDIIENYRELPSIEKNFWRVIAFGLVILPLLILVF